MASSNVSPLSRFFLKPLLDVRLGFALMRDRRVPVRTKVLALLIGVVVTALVEFLEFPIEGVLSMMLPLLGVLGDVVVDGAEAIAGPLLLAGALLPLLAPRNVVSQIRSERSTGAPNSPIIDI